MQKFRQNRTQTCITMQLHSRICRYVRDCELMPTTSNSLMTSMIISWKERKRNLLLWDSMTNIFVLKFQFLHCSRSSDDGHYQHCISAFLETHLLFHSGFCYAFFFGLHALLEKRFRMRSCIFCDRSYLELREEQKFFKP